MQSEGKKKELLWSEHSNYSHGGLGAIFTKNKGLIFVYFLAVFDQANHRGRIRCLSTPVGMEKECVHPPLLLVDQACTDLSDGLVIDFFSLAIWGRKALQGLIVCWDYYLLRGLLKI